MIIARKIAVVRVVVAAKDTRKQKWSSRIDHIIQPVGARQSCDRLFTLRERHSGTSDMFYYAATHNGYIRENIHTSTRLPDHCMQKMSICSQSSECKGPYSEETQNRDERTMRAMRCIYQQFIANRAESRRSEISQRQQSGNPRYTGIYEWITMCFPRSRRPRMQLHMSRA